MKIKSAILFLFMILLCIVMLGCQASEGHEEVEGLESYHDARFNFSIKYPKKWTYMTFGQSTEASETHEVSPNGGIELFIESDRASGETISVSGLLGSLNLHPLDGFTEEDFQTESGLGGKLYQRQTGDEIIVYYVINDKELAETNFNGRSLYAIIRMSTEHYSANEADLKAMLRSVDIIKNNVIELNNLTKEIAVESYIKMLADNDITAILEILPPESLGRRDTTDYGTQPMTLEEAETVGLLKKGDRYVRSDESIASQITMQHEIVKRSFGDNSWDSVTYTFEKRTPSDGRTGYIDRTSNKEITEKEYEELNRAYWKNIAKEHGITYDQLYSFTDINSETEQFFSSHTIYQDNLAGMPAAYETFADYELYWVNLAFNNKTTSEDGLEKFGFYISNKSGEWRVKSGLTWEVSLDIPLQDGDH